jgi:hypothetical protein
MTRAVRGTATVAGYYVYVVDEESWSETGSEEPARPFGLLAP